jgi:GNAT superfamily N-acetyltransferase
MTTPYSIRQVKPEDAAIVAAHGCFQASDLQRRAAYEAWVRPRIKSSAYVGWVATAGGQVIAGAGAVLLDWGPTRANPSVTMARIANVFTEEEFRRRGIARSLLRAVMTHCESKGIREFNLATSAEGRALYIDLGFQSYPHEMRRRVVEG